MKRFRISDLPVCQVPNVMHCLPVGTRLVPAGSFEEGRPGWVILPPEEALESEEKFMAWRDSIYNAAIDVNMSLNKMEYPATVVSLDNE